MGRFSGVLIAAVLFALLPFSSPADDMLVTEPEKVLLSGPPSILSCSLETGLLILSDGASVRSVDMATGRVEWERRGVQNRTGVFKDTVVVTNMNTITVLNRSTGDILWEKTISSFAEFYSSIVLPGGGGVVAQGDAGVVLCFPGWGWPKTITPQRESPMGLVDNGDNLLSMVYTDNEDTFEFVRRDTEKLGEINRYQLKLGRQKIGWPLMALLPGNRFFTANSGDGEGTIRPVLYDAATGAELKKLPAFSGVAMSAVPLPRENAVFCVSKDASKGWLVSLDSEGPPREFSRENHFFMGYRRYAEEGDEMPILSKDENGSIWAWSVADGAPVTKVLDGAAFTPGNPGIILDESRLLLYETGGRSTVYDFVLQKPVMSARMKDVYGSGTVLVDNDCQTMVCQAYTGENRGDYMASTRYAVFKRGNPEPVCQGKGRPSFLSGDGRHMLLQEDYKHATLVRLEDQAILGQWAFEGYGNIGGAFSGDNARAAVIFGKDRQIVPLDVSAPPVILENPEKSTQLAVHSVLFSRDGTSLLASSWGRAYLYDAGSGKLLQTYEETERFASMYQSPNMSLGGAVRNTLEDLAGMFTDRFKGSPQIRACFSGDNEAFVATETSGQLARVWNRATGAQIHTLRTGLPEVRDKRGQINNQIVFSKNGNYALSFNGEGLAEAALWSVPDAGIVRRYQLGGIARYARVQVADDGSAVHILSDNRLCRWPGKLGRE